MKETQKVEIGKVVCYQSDPTSCVGVLEVLDTNHKPTGVKLRFFEHDARFLAHNGETPTFSDQYRMVRGENTSLPMPTVGQLIVFSRYEDPERDEVIAAPWSYFTTWSCMQQYLNNRPRYRVICWWQDPQLSTDAVWHEKVEWEGSNVEELSVCYPRRQFRQGDSIITDDVLPTEPELAEGVRRVYSFERLVAGDWAPSTDPRTALCCLNESTFRHYANNHDSKGPCMHRER